MLLCDELQLALLLLLLLLSDNCSALRSCPPAS
jgi:hypothetical protein